MVGRFSLRSTRPLAHSSLARQSNANLVKTAIDNLQLAIKDLEQAGVNLNFGIGGLATSVVVALGLIVKALQDAFGIYD